MKLGPVTKLEKRNKTRPDVLSGNCDAIVIFGILANLGQPEGRIPDTESAKVIFSVIVTFCFTKTENRTKIPLTQLSHY